MQHLHGLFAHMGSGPAPATEGRLIRWARSYDTFVSLFSLGQSGRLRRRTVELAGIGPGARVLDVGCGTGELTRLAAARAGSQGEAVGIDAAPEMIEVARQNAGRQKAASGDRPARFEVAVVERIPFPDASFDVVLSSLMMHHLPGDLKQRGLAEIYRVLKPGGRVLIVDMRDRPSALGTALRTLSGHGSRQRQSGDLASLLAESGFAEVTTGPLALGFVDYTAGVKR